MQVIKVMDSGRADPHRRTMLWCFGLIAAFSVIDCLYGWSTYKVLKAIGFLLILYSVYRNGAQGPFLARALGQTFSRGAFGLGLAGFLLAAGAFVVHVLT
ncbi:hypothetical protein SAMN05428989_3774 [Pseudoxanthomonas sp. GM95]|uniref:hypothetical protein n=1 Tax=Pseudoxanthomonas sp. GM95 TaxID=1881043 RepID=UPI0008CBF776|nr:hypothetical protein [Pseudoxanthomonas sp. GM95]SEM41029.1 hypothetical protein SAMN05428989_3774 [Pseudoxanthomonas sp. GM95]